MKRYGKWAMFLAALYWMLILCGCAGASTDAGETLPQLGGEPQTGSAVSYLVTVTDEAGNPMSGVMVQLCSSICVPGTTDEDGVAEFTMTEDTYKVSVTILPEGYTCEAEYQFPENSRELTIVLTAE